MRSKQAAEFLKRRDGNTIALDPQGPVRDAVHVFDKASIEAVSAALAARRPLLVSGEPGTGKSQLARASAKALRRTYVPFVVDSRTEARDLLWSFDAVARLAEAQTLGPLGLDKREIRERLRIDRFIHPGPLWWAFDWAGAERQPEPEEQDGGETPARLPCPQASDADPGRGCVVLIDEVDKAESDVPNGLLEALGTGRFQVEGLARPVESVGEPPLVIITTNGERALPDAFVRRCLVLVLSLPTGEDFVKLMVQRGRKHFEDLKPGIVEDAARLIAEDRKKAQRQGRQEIPSGQAEFLDLLRAIEHMAPGNLKRQRQVMERISAYVLGKQRINLT